MSMKEFRYCHNGSWVSLGKPIKDLNTLEVGKKYFVISGIWSAPLIYCGHVHSKREFTFTFGKTSDSWINNFSICDYKSNLKVFNYAQD